MQAGPANATAATTGAHRPPTARWRKQRRDAPAHFFDVEAAGLAWLRVAGGPRVVRVLGVGADFLDLERLEPGTPNRSAAAEFGGALARLHQAGASYWGQLPPAVACGFFGPLSDPLPMPSSRAWPTWADFYGKDRLRTICDQGLARGVFTSDDAGGFSEVIDRLPVLIGAGVADPPARLHGDLWSGNLFWTRARRLVKNQFPSVSQLRSLRECAGEQQDAADSIGASPRNLRVFQQIPSAVLIDPAAHGGHREADLAMLALFGAPFLDDIVAGYQARYPLADGWRDRIPLHQLYPLAGHAVLFGGGYLPETRAVLRALAG